MPILDQASLICTLREARRRKVSRFQAIRTIACPLKVQISGWHTTIIDISHQMSVLLATKSPTCSGTRHLNIQRLWGRACGEMEELEA